MPESLTYFIKIILKQYFMQALSNRRHHGEMSRPAEMEKLLQKGRAVLSEGTENLFSFWFFIKTFKFFSKFRSQFYLACKPAKDKV